MLGVPPTIADGDTVVAAGGRLQTTSERGAGLRVLVSSIVNLLKSGTTARTKTLQDTDATLAEIETQPVASFQNKLINPRFDIWQRGTTFTPTLNTETYDADRFFTKIDGTSVVFTVSQQAHALGTLTDEPTYFRRCAITTAGTSSTITKILAQRIEGVRTLPGKKVMLSFKAKADAARTVTPNYVQCFGTGGAPSANVTGAGSGVALTTSWSTYTQVINLPSISGKTMGTTAGTDYLEVWLSAAANTVQTIDISDIEIKEVSTSAQVNNQFEVRPPQVELALCQRYLPTLAAYSGSNFVGNGMGLSGTQAQIVFQFIVPPRTVPTGMVTTAVGGFSAGDGTANFTATAMSFSGAGLVSALITLTAASGIVQYRPYTILFTGGSYIYLTGCEL